MESFLQIIFFTLVPALELRASIPFGIFYTDLPWLSVFITAIISNIILGFVVFYLMKIIIQVITKIKFVNSLWQKYVERTRKKIHEGVEKYGEWAVAVFIGIPLPGSGVYTGALAAFLIGLDPKKFWVANVVGVLIAGVVVTIVSLTGSGLAEIFLKEVSQP
ncbi:MAG: small multi-drug export protein [Candidatus Marinimicrobia bacterium]|nr:small multi-drug export protein [Candidatus Neomarinimicrobiota bacterium]